MRIHNLRFGYACNSSSTHSILIFPKKHNFIDSDCDAGRYGWQEFIAASKPEKLRYLSCIFWYSVKKSQLPPYILDYYAKHWLDGVANFTDMENFDQYIDHQSIIRPPTYHNSDFINKEFFDVFKKQLLNPKVAVFGGNDNSYEGESHDGTEMPAAACLPREYPFKIIARHDPLYDYFTIFHEYDTYGGKRRVCKLRVSFNDDEVKYASLPELVDLKITNKCERNCAYCYQNSTKEGKHAKNSAIHGTLEALAELQVLEIALGGGEPTLHPEFHNIVKKCRKLGMVPSFTTRNLNWFRDPLNVQLVKEYAGGVAISCNHTFELNEINAIAAYHNLEDQLSIQVIDQVGPVRDIIKGTDLPVILLGYKKTPGCATSFADEHKNLSRHINFYDVAANTHRIGIDTKYALDYADEIAEVVHHAAHKVMTCTQEGVFSMYIDAVEETMAPSSYTGEPEKITGWPTSKAIKDYFIQCSIRSADGEPVREHAETSC